MIKKDVRLSPKKDGHCNVSSYSGNIGATETKNCGFIVDGIVKPIEKIIDTENNQIIIRIKADD